MRSITTFAYCACIILAAFCAGNDNSTTPAKVKPNEHFKTEPNFKPQVLEHVYKTRNESLLYSGYVFVALMQKPNRWGPRIYDNDGNLVWYGSPSIGKNRITDFHSCDYLESQGKHLCWHDQEHDPSSDRPLLKKIVVDNTYSLVRNYTTRGNHHEFNMVDNGAKFVTMDYLPKPWDLRPYCGKEDGWIKDACIVEYDVRSGKESWSWCFTDHFPVFVSTVYFLADKACQQNDTAPKAGRGTAKEPWDIGHLNAVDKDAAGDYIASFRHVNEIMKIAGPSNTQTDPGTVLWRLGGRGNQFDKDFEFSRQHMVRFVNKTSNEDHTIIAHFNNAWEGVLTPSANASSGQVIRIDTKEKKAELLHEYRHPHNKLVKSRGSMQTLPNGNALVGWGNLPEFSEYSSNGTLLLHAQFGAFNSGQYSYRAFKASWKGYPTWPPKLVAYSKTCGARSPLFVYASWNGATEIQQWRFRTAPTPSGPWKRATTVKRTGFETCTRLIDATAAYVSADALDVDGKVLGSVIERRFVPQAGNGCDEYGCPAHFAYDANEGINCRSRSLLPSTMFFAFLILIEYSVNVLCGAIYASPIT